MNGKHFLTKDQIETKLNVEYQTLFYNGLKSAIPQKWLKLISANANIRNQPEAEISIDLSVKIDSNIMQLQNVKCNQIYKSEIHSKGQLPTIYYKWESESIIIWVVNWRQESHKTDDCCLHREVWLVNV